MISKEMNAIYWIDIENIVPNPYQPRTEFNDEKIITLAESVKQYGILQPLVVTVKEKEDENGGFSNQYELIAGERRLRAAKVAGLSSVPVIIRSSLEGKRTKLELAIIENLQREDLNPRDKANAFKKLVDEFNLKHSVIADRMGKSREYVTNSIRLLSLPEDMLDAMSQGKISEGHARPLLLLKDKLLEQRELFNEMVSRKLTVRDSERIAKKMADKKDPRVERDRSPRIQDFERNFEEFFGTRVYIEAKRMGGGKILIDFFSQDDLDSIYNRIIKMKEERRLSDERPVSSEQDDNYNATTEESEKVEQNDATNDVPDKRDKDSKEDDFYSFNNFSV